MRSQRGRRPTRQTINRSLTRPRNRPRMSIPSPCQALTPKWQVRARRAVRWPSLARATGCSRHWTRACAPRRRRSGGNWTMPLAGYSAGVRSRLGVLRRCTGKPRQSCLWHPRLKPRLPRTHLRAVGRARVASGARTRMRACHRDPRQRLRWRRAPRTSQPSRARRRLSGSHWQRRPCCSRNGSRSIHLTRQPGK